MRLFRRYLPLLVAGACFSACAAHYQQPKWSSTNGTYNDSTAVKAHIDKHLDEYNRVMKAEAGTRDIFAGSTILAALGGTTAMALGAGTNVGILAGSIGAGANAGNSYARPHERMQLIEKAISATICVRDEFSNQMARRSALGVTARVADLTQEANRKRTNLSATQTFLSTNTFVARQIDDAGEIAVDASRSIATTLQSKLIASGTLPDYANIVKSIQDAQKAADANKPPAGAGLLESSGAGLLEDVSEYETRIITCRAKLPS